MPAAFNQIQRADLQQRLMRGLGIQERSPAPVLSPDVQAVVLLEDFTTQSPYVAPTGRHACAFGQVAAVAAQFTQFELINPTGTGVVGVGKKLIFSTNASALMAWGFRIDGAPDLVSSTTRQWTDQRLGGFPTLTVKYSARAAIEAFNLGIARCSSVDALQIQLPDVVLEPGRVLRCQCLSLNVPLDFSIEWEEWII